MTTATHHKKLRIALQAEIRHLTRCMQQMGRVDEETYALGRDLFSTDAALVQWLCAPERTLRGATPLATMRTVKGRGKVAESLKQITYGVPV